jgi:hypothetical protein
MKMGSALASVVKIFLLFVSGRPTIEFFKPMFSIPIEMNFSMFQNYIINETENFIVSMSDHI